MSDNLVQRLADALRKHDPDAAVLREVPCHCCGEVNYSWMGMLGAMRRWARVRGMTEEEWAEMKYKEEMDERL